MMWPGNASSTTPSLRRERRACASLLALLSPDDVERGSYRPAPASRCGAAARCRTTRTGRAAAASSRGRRARRRGRTASRGSERRMVSSARRVSGRASRTSPPAFSSREAAAGRDPHASAREQRHARVLGQGRARARAGVAGRDRRQGHGLHGGRARAAHEASPRARPAPGRQPRGLEIHEPERVARAREPQVRAPRGEQLHHLLRARRAARVAVVARQRRAGRARPFEERAAHTARSAAGRARAPRAARGPARARLLERRERRLGRAPCPRRRRSAGPASRSRRYDSRCVSSCCSCAREGRAEQIVLAVRGVAATGRRRGRSARCRRSTSAARRARPAV